MQMTPEAILKEYFGYDRFRAGQAPLVQRILSGGDVLGIMPTGAGKSVCYQVPAMLLTGMTIVISPLISLMEDQVAALREAGIPAACLHSNLDSSAYYRTLDAVRNGEVRLLYAAPERLLTDMFLSLTDTVAIAMVAVDEAHCLSQWGQDFRPSYLQITEFLHLLPRRPVVAAFTATATETVRADIRRLLDLQSPLELVTGFDRANLRWIVERPSNKYRALLEVLKRNRGKSGIVYCISRNQTDKVCEKLRADGYAAGRYHAGMSAEERSANQEAFLHDELQIITATNAFGMGIDKSNVSFVVHYNMPKSMEAYYQEAGRAGRDGSPAECVLLFSAQDISTNMLLIESSAQDNDRLTPQQRGIIRRKDEERLQAMVRYCSLTDCLRHYILRYFGEESPDHCGNCGSCLTDTETVDATVPAQKILSCVYRVRQRGSACGAKMLCDILQGKDTKQLQERGYAQLSTYGLMQDVSRVQLEHMVNILISRGYLVTDTGQYRTLSLGERAIPVLRGQKQVSMSLPLHDLKETRRAQRLAAMPDYELDDALFQKLRKVRERLAAREHMPAYIVFSDATLREMCVKRPSDEEELLAISGVGRHKLEKYGAAFLEALSGGGV